MVLAVAHPWASSSSYLSSRFSPILAATFMPLAVFSFSAAFPRAIDWRERRGRAACLGRRGGRGRRVAAPRGGDGTLPLHMRAIGRKGDVSEGSGENGSGVGQRVAEARIVAVRAGVSGCAVGAQWWS